MSWIRRLPSLAAPLLLAGSTGVGLAANAPITVTESSDALHRNGCAANGAPPCSLRDAILFANSRPGPDTIVFAIGSGPVSIRLASALPVITEPIVLDGTKQPGWAGAPIVELDGAAAGDEAAGLEITAGSSTVRGLVLNRFRSTAFGAIVLLEKGGNTLQGNFVGTDVSGAAARGNRGTGILIRGDHNTIGGTEPAARNVVSGNGGDGIRIQGAGNLVLGNLVGTDVSGIRALANTGDGLSVKGGNTIGGVVAGSRNLVSGNGGTGISAGPSETIQGNFVGTNVAGIARLANGKGGIAGGGRIGGSEGTKSAGPCSGACNLISGNHGPGAIPASATVLEGNFIGTDASGKAALGNTGAGVFVNTSSRARVGSETAQAGNLVSGNDGPGIDIAFEAEGTAVRGNVIGADVSRMAALPNAEGVRVRESAHGNRIGGDSIMEGNLIAFNVGPGVVIESSAGGGNTILANSIFSNGALGIDLGRDGVTPNRGPRSEGTPDAWQNFPVLTVVTPYSVEGTLEGPPETMFRLEFFTNATCDPSGYGQGQTRIAVSALTTDSGGEASFGVSLTAPRGQGVSATATDAAGNTSEFSPCVLPVAQGEGGGGWTR